MIRTLKFASLAMSFALVAATAAHAVSITLSLSAPTASFADGTETLTYAGTITALSDVYLNGDSLARQAKFVPLPEKVQASAYREIAKVSNSNGELLGAKMMGNPLN